MGTYHAENWTAFKRQPWSPFSTVHLRVKFLPNGVTRLKRFVAFQEWQQWFRWLGFEGRGSWSTCARGCKNLAGNWREEFVLSTSFNECVCDGSQLQALRPCGGDYSSMLRLTEVHTPLISQNVHVLDCMTIDSRMTLLSMVMTDGDICNSRTITDQLQFFGVMASPNGLPKIRCGTKISTKILCALIILSSDPLPRACLEYWRGLGGILTSQPRVYALKPCMPWSRNQANCVVQSVSICMSETTVIGNHHNHD